MLRTRLLIHATFLLLLPVIVALFDLGVPAAIALVLLALLWRWMIVLSGIMAPPATPTLVLDAIGLSHYVEKVRWCMDRLGLDYTEKQSAGTLGVFFTGRTVPQLRIRTGLVQSVIGNSPEILRYLWGTHAAPLGDKARFLEPTADRLELEKDLDRYGRNLQVWVYHHLLEDRELTLRAWGAHDPQVPAWQRSTLTLIYPLLAALIRRSFRLSDGHYAKATLKIEELLSAIETRLADGRGSILGGAELNYTDISFAALSGVWLQPQAYGGGKAEGCRIDRNEMPAAMRADVERWLEDHPKAAGWVEQLYAEQRFNEEAE